MRPFKSEFVEIMDCVHPNHRPSGEIVWHYTNDHGVLGIIESKSLHAASISLLNDSGELRHGMDTLAKFWKEKKKVSDWEDKLVQAWFHWARDDIQEERIRNSFILSASVSGESQPLFLLYGSYAIGIRRTAQLTKERYPPTYDSELNPNFEFGWRKVIYLNNAKKKVRERLYNELVKLAKYKCHIEPVGTCPICSLAQDCIFQTAVYFKDESFAHEREVRLYGRAKETGAEVKFKTGTYGVVPYLEVKVQSLLNESENDLNFPIEKINLCPGLIAPESAKVGVELALESYGYNNGEEKPIKVEILSTTFRPG